MHTLDHNAIGRSLKVIGFQLAVNMHKARHQADDYRLAEVFEHHQLAVSGTAGTGAFTDFSINFQEVLYYAPTQRNNKLEDPQVTHGVQLDSGDAKLIVYVTKWLLDDSANYLGAVVRIGAEEVTWSPGSSYSGTVHITFQGLGVPVEDPGFTDTP
jgi:hypothetical protein